MSNHSTFDTHNSTLKMAAQVGIAPTPFRLTGGRTTLIPLSKGGRLKAEFWITSAFSLRQNWSARQDLHLRSLGPKPSVLLLHYALNLPRRSSER